MTDPAPAPEAPADPFSLSPADATAKLNEMAAAFRAPPAPTTATTPAEAAARLRNSVADPKWRDNYLAGTVAQRREFDELTALAASGDAQIAPEVELVDAVSDTHAVSKSNYNAMVDAVRDQGLPDSAERYIRDLDAGLRTDRPTTGDGIAARQALDRIMKNENFRRDVLNADPAANNLLNVLNRVIAYAAEDDGQAISEHAVEALAKLGLR